MTVVFSSSSPIASVALIGANELLAERAEEAGHKASGTLLFLLDKLLAECGRELRDARLFVADIGPGSFTGVKVGVTLAKTMAFAMRLPVAGVTSFDLIASGSAVVIPSRKGEAFLRGPGSEPQIVNSPPAGAVGYGPFAREQTMPLASRALGVLDRLAPVAPELLVPLYVAEPSISKPKDPRVTGGRRA